jgi:hypothetical protein
MLSGSRYLFAKNFLLSFLSPLPNIQASTGLSKSDDLHAEVTQMSLQVVLVGTKYPDKPQEAEKTMKRIIFHSSYRFLCLLPLSSSKPIFRCNVLGVREYMSGKVIKRRSGDDHQIPRCSSLGYLLQALSKETRPIYLFFSPLLEVCCPLQIVTETWSTANLRTDLHC